METYRFSYVKSLYQERRNICGRLKVGLLNGGGHLIEVSAYVTRGARIIEVAARGGTWAEFDGSSAHAIKLQALQF